MNFADLTPEQLALYRELKAAVIAERCRRARAGRVAKAVRIRGELVEKVRAAVAGADPVHARIAVSKVREELRDSIKAAYKAKAALKTKAAQ